MDCALAGTCGACPWLGLHAREAQRAAKIQALRDALGWPETPRLVDVGDAGMRDRVDMQLRRDGDLTLGFGALADPRAMLDVAVCPLLSPALAAWLADFRADLPPVTRAAVRLRVATTGERGVWLDVAHSDVKALLDEHAWLARMTSQARVELGPKAREVQVEGGSARLVPASASPWFSSWIGDRELPLYTRIADFTQPSRAANRSLIASIIDHVAATGAARWLELGAGAGNLTLPLSQGRHVRAVELDGEALRDNLARAGVGASVEVVAASFTRAADVAVLVSGRDAILADPPRSGLGPFAEALSGLAPSLRPEHLVCVSCHLEALTRDAATLSRAGYRPVAVTGVDQFPHTPQAEWIVTFQRT